MGTANLNIDVECRREKNGNSDVGRLAIPDRTNVTLVPTTLDETILIKIILEMAIEMATEMSILSQTGTKTNANSRTQIISFAKIFVELICIDTMQIRISTWLLFYVLSLSCVHT